MPTVISEEVAAAQLMGLPHKWKEYPVLQVVRCTETYEKVTTEIGILYDVFRRYQTTGYSATVFRTDSYHVPGTLAGLMSLEKIVFDLPEEIAAAGWRPSQ